ncbi:amino acid permease [Candidatus Methylacidithermus pantelleriae]|uniref:Uncharacterized amino acid permease YhdG n=1 Tax=Candidatus Methylacidithermus pantelleriae TaxID=2744239 RepID=A0A8J2FX98_9BACT|nr:amino acid permease [Candidatus Methylacidithermus pantelleriae]CAF0703912.1 Uncharacterized amino acid permease YhdG [Candidatus Methylacidithermus pantelleriae]
MPAPTGGKCETRLGSLWQRFFRLRHVPKSARSRDTPNPLRRVLGAPELIALGVGGIIGAGIYVLTGAVASQHAGPAVCLSFVLSGSSCALAALCYAELASMIPAAGSAYVYAYATMGEAMAWTIGWSLVLEYLFTVGLVSIGWSGYFSSLLRDIGILLPPEWTAPYGTHLVQLPGQGWVIATGELAQWLRGHGVHMEDLPQASGWVNVPAVAIVLSLSALLVLGIRESATLNTAIVLFKTGALLCFVAAAFRYLTTHPEVWHQNWDPFVPPNRGEFGQFGWSGVLRGAGMIFFAYLGFDVVSTAGQEAKNPQRDLPIGILGSLSLCTILYVLVAIALTGAVHYSRLAVPDPIAVGVEAIGARWLAPVVKLGAISGISSVILVFLLGQSRIFWAMAEDGLLPPHLARIHPRFQTPYVATVVSGVAGALLGAFCPILVLNELVSIGTLFAFILVCLGVLILRHTQPELPRPFRVPWVPWLPLAGVGICFLQMVSLPARAWARLILWLILGWALYLGYGIHRSKACQELPAPSPKSASPGA